MPRCAALQSNAFWGSVTIYFSKRVDVRRDYTLSLQIKFVMGLGYHLFSKCVDARRDFYPFSFDHVIL